MDVRRAMQGLIVAASVVVVTVAATGAAQTPAAEPDEPCPPKNEVDLEGVKPLADTPPGALVSDKPEGLFVRFGKDRDPITRKFFLVLPDRSKAVLPPMGTELRVRQRPLEREEAENVIDDESYVANASVTGEREVTLQVCIDPSVHPGTYKGIVTLEHPYMRPVVVPIEASLQFPEWLLLALIVGVVVLVSAPLYVWASRQRGTTTDGNNILLSRRAALEFRSWILSNFIAFAVATIAGTSAFLANYWYDPSWGAEAPKDWFTLIGAVFTAFTTGLLTGTAAPKVSDEPQADPDAAAVEPG